MLRILLNALVIALLLLPAAAHARQVARQVWAPVLIYHHVKWFQPSDNAIERGLTITPPQFKAELDYLAAHHYRTITAAQLIISLRTAQPLPAHPVTLSFDDGYADVYASVYQVLRRRHMTATFFIVPGFLNRPRYLTWQQVEDMSRHGMDIEGHTMTHPDLTTVPRAQVLGEIGGCRQILQARLHRAVRLFAYPYGDYNVYVIQTVQKAGFLAAFTTHQGWWQNSAALFTLPRVYVDNDDTAQIFAGRLTANPEVLVADPA